jgi:hypothetical protein
VGTTHLQANDYYHVPCAKGWVGETGKCTGVGCWRGFVEDLLVVPALSVHASLDVVVVSF